MKPIVDHRHSILWFGVGMILMPLRAFPTEGAQIEKDYYPNGVLQSARPYRNGRLDGESIWYHENGKEKSRVEYRNGVQEGTTSWYDVNGNIIEKTKYVGGKFHSRLDGDPTPLAKVEELPALTRGCRKGNATDCFDVGRFYQRAKDKEKAKEFLEPSCRKGVVKACHNLGVVQWSCQSMEPAVEAFSKACDAGFGASCINRAMLEEKLGRFDDAAKHYSLACSMGVDQACTRQQSFPVARVVLPLWKTLNSHWLIYVGVLMVVSLLFGQLALTATRRRVIEQQKGRDESAAK